MPCAWEYLNQKAATDEVIYHKYYELLEFRIGDVRDYHSVAEALREADVVVNAAALKQVPTCEYFPHQAVMTNINGPENIVRAISELRLPVETVVGVSTDKACKPVNVMGMTKAIQERLFIQANLRCPRHPVHLRAVWQRAGFTRFSHPPVSRSNPEGGAGDHHHTRHDPVLIEPGPGSRYRICRSKGRQAGRDVHSTGAVGAGDRYCRHSDRGTGKSKKWLPASGREKKVHEILVSEEEIYRTVDRQKYYAIQSILPEIDGETGEEHPLKEEYSSATDVMTRKMVAELLRKNRLMIEDVQDFEGELLR